LFIAEETIVKGVRVLPVCMFLMGENPKFRIALQLVLQTISRNRVDELKGLLLQVWQEKICGKLDGFSYLCILFLVGCKEFFRSTQANKK
jgi:hypothetical protein